MAITKPLPGSTNTPLGGNTQESGVNASGGLSIAKVSGLSSDIGTAATNILTASGGDIEIEDVILETDSTGLAGGTTFEVLTDDAMGLAIFVSMAISSLGANTSHAFEGSTPWTVYVPKIIRAGNHVQILGTSSACTGAGKWDLYIKYRPCTQNAVLS